MLPAKRRLSQTDFTADEVAAAVAAAVAAEKALTAEAVSAALAIAQTAAAETAAAIAETTAATIAAAQSATAATAAAFSASASTTAAAASTREQNWICGVCKDLYDKPTTTPCGHTFCLECIKSAINQVKAKCPICLAKVSRTLPLAVNIDMQEFIAENAGPLFVARKEKLKKSETFYKELVDLDPMSAFDALSPDVNLSLFVGDAALKLTPLLWACKNAKDVKVIEWNHLIKALLKAGADVNVRDIEENSALFYALSSCHLTTVTTAIPVLLDRGARDPRAPFFGVRLPTLNLFAEEINSFDAILLRMIEDASYSGKPITGQREDLGHMLKNGHDRTAVALYDKNFPLEVPKKMLQWAALGGCVVFIRRLLAANIDLSVDHVFNNKQTALHVACLYGQEKAAQALLECGASDFSRDEFNRTPLDYAVKAEMTNVADAIKKAMKEKGLQQK
jgi:ankyrin repeat protein